MSIGLIALLDDVAGLAKVAAASIDDVAGQAAKAGSKAAGVVIDDAAVTPRYVVGFAASRELPIVAKIAIGSLKNKLLFLLPVALLLSTFAPWAIWPLLMVGGAYLCYEGAEKVYEAVFPHRAQAHDAEDGAEIEDAKALEDRKVAGAIRTDFILSAEIMAISLAAVPENSSFLTKAVVLAVVAVGITVAVYGAVALIVKADDAGVALAGSDSPSAFGRLTRALGRGLVRGMPVFLRVLTVVGTAAMIWVGGSIVVHGLEKLGVTGPGEVIHHAAEAVAHAVPAVSGLVGWIVEAACYGLVGLVLGAILIPITGYVIAPAYKGAKAGIAKVRN